ncbi:MAG TPA: EAL domain-containing protein [Acidimicrobiales bacterium]|nr:EAL domain-containing protein [Acidimicrobiales bacterium]
MLQSIRQQPRIVVMNSAFIALAGSRSNRMVGRSWEVLFTSATRDVAAGALSCLDHEPVRCDVALRTGSAGMATPVELELIPLVDAVRGDRCMVILRDLSEHHNAKTQAARSAERLRLATDVGRIGTWEWNPRTGELLWDEMLRSILGVSSAEAASHHLWSALIHPDDLVGAARDARALLTGELDEYESHYRIRRPDGSLRHVLTRSRVNERDDLGDATQLLGMLLDITELQKATEQRETLLSAERAARAVAEQASAQLARMAAIDPLTGLVNRTELYRWVAGALGRHERVAVLLFGLDHFKLVNDSYGHSVGDVVLIELAHRLQNHIRDGDLVARFAGDEYVVATIVNSAGDATVLAERLMTAISMPIVVSEARLELTASAGLALSAADGTTAPETMFADADLAKHHAKGRGRGQACWFDASLRAAMTHRRHIQSELREAIATNQLRLHFQPSYDIKAGHLMSVEALLRWTNPRLGTLGPGEFIPVAEETELIQSLGRWVITNAARARQQWRAPRTDCPLFINSSLRELNRPGYADDVLTILADIALKPSQLGIEVTESIFSADNRGLCELAQLHAHGIKIALDDFGTGYSSLSRLWQFPIDIIKIDRTFIAEMHNSASVRAIVSTIVDLAQTLGSKTIAEGVETLDQLQILRDIGCDQASGYLLGAPAAILTQQPENPVLRPRSAAHVRLSSVTPSPDDRVSDR